MDDLINELVEEVRSLKRKIEGLVIEDKSIGEWMKEEDVIRLTGLSKSTLLILRNENKVKVSSFFSKKKFYRVKDFEQILNRNGKL